MIRSALGEPNLDLHGISSAARFKIGPAAVAFVVGSRQLDEPAVGMLLALAETDVFRRGGRPSLVASNPR